MSVTTSGTLTGLHSATPYAVELDWASRPRSVYWSGPSDATGVCMMIDQRFLPHHHDIVSHSTYKEVAVSIKNMLVRGAPAIGAAGGFAMSLAAFKSQAKDKESLIIDLLAAKKELDGARPTAVNLSWATSRIMELVHLLLAANTTNDLTAIRSAILTEAQELADDDVRINKRLGDYGASVLPSPRQPPTLNFLHHCNTGSLATVDYGTALGVIYSAFHQKRNIHVWVDETRPRLQGSRLTAYELMREGVNMSLIVDNAAGLLMYQNKVDVVVFGADRVAANGDVANKIGTYKVAVCAYENGIPVYACVPTSTIDLNIQTGREITIEDRDDMEVTHPQTNTAASIAPINVHVFNPAFDITPFKYLTAIITEEGICYPPFQQSLTQAKHKAEERLRQEWRSRAQKYTQISSTTATNS